MEKKLVELVGDEEIGNEEIAGLLRQVRDLTGRVVRLEEALDKIIQDLEEDLQD